jgi:predicted DNA binding CopG/RHH family protein
MAKKFYESSPCAVPARRSAKPTQKDDQIDFSDIPQSTDEELKRARRVGRPKSGSAKQLIAIRISPKLLAQLRRLAAKRDKPYQTLIHELLEKATRKSKVA